MVVGVEDSGAEEVMQERDGVITFRVVFETGFEDVFNVGRVSGDDITMAFAWAEEGGSVGWGRSENLGGPVEEAVAVSYELW